MIGATSATTLIERIYSDRCIPIEGGGSTPLNVYIPREEGELLMRLVQELRPEATLEVGMANGLSTLFIASALEANGYGHHVAIDPFQSTDWRSVGMGLVSQAGLAHRVELREEFGHRALVDLDREGFRPTLAFIDGSHLFDYALSDFLLIDRIMPIGGMIAFDDSDWPALRGVIRYVLANRSYDIVRGLPIVEVPPGAPGLAARLARWVLRKTPRLSSIVRPSWLNTDAELARLGRCVVLKKLGCDARDGRDRSIHYEF